MRPQSCSGIWPQLGAAGQVLAQPLAITLLYAAVRGGQAWFGDGLAPPQPVDLWPVGVLAFVLCAIFGLGFYLARRSAALRLVLTVGWPLIMLGLGVPLLIQVPVPEAASAGQLMRFLDVAGAFFVFPPSAAGLAWATAQGMDASASDLWQALLHWLGLLPLQALLLFMCAEFARDALRRRRWG